MAARQSDSLEDMLNADPPPERIHAVEVDLYSETHTISSYPRGLGYGILRLDWHRKDGTTLHYMRWVDEDGHWFYPAEEVQRRAAASR